MRKMTESQLDATRNENFTDYLPPLDIPCYTLFNRRIRSEVFACFGYRLLANFHIAFAVNQYRRSSTKWKQVQ
jgi:hypothetical protein